MPKITTLTEEEFKATASKPKSASKRISKQERTRRRYQRYLEPFVKGGYIEVILKPGEKKQTEKLRFKRAADSLGLTLKFKRSQKNIRFEVLSK